MHRVITSLILIFYVLAILNTTKSIAAAGEQMHRESPSMITESALEEFAINGQDAKGQRFNIQAKSGKKISESKLQLNYISGAINLLNQPQITFSGEEAIVDITNKQIKIIGKVTVQTANNYKITNDFTEIIYIDAYVISSCNTITKIHTPNHHFITTDCLTYNSSTQHMKLRNVQADFAISEHR